MTKKKTLKVLGFGALATLVCATLAVQCVATSIEADAADYTVQELYAEGYSLDIELEEDGAVLFQNENNTLPLEKGTGVDIFGYCGYNVIQGGGGSGKGLYDSKCIQEFEAFNLSGLNCNEDLWNWYSSSSGPNIFHESWVSSSSTYANSDAYNIPEVDKYYYESRGGADLCDPDNNVAIVTFGRQGHEGAELPMDMSSYSTSIRYWGTQAGYGSADRTYLDPTETELELLQYIKEDLGYDKVIVLINSSNVMTIGEYLEYSDACLWIGGPGESGLIGVGNLLQGKNNSGLDLSPSGATADTWMTDFYSNIVHYNNGASSYDNSSGGNWGNGQYNQYEEGIFMGYRWYETAYADGVEVSYNGTTYDYANDYDDLVAMPFGGGLSYTDFEWEVVDSDIQLTAHGTNSITVKVTNTGDYAGKDTVQVYVHAPYNEGGIDKAEVSLVGFAKTDRLKPGESGQVTIEFDTDDFASYDYLGYKTSYDTTDYNGNPKWGGYVLEAGDYEFRIQTDSHTQMTDPVEATLASDILYTEDGVGARDDDATVAYNKINDVNAGDGNLIWMQRSTIEDDWATITKGGREDEKADEGVSLRESQAEMTDSSMTQQTSKVTLEAPYQDTTKDITITYGYQCATEFVGNDNNYWGLDNNDDTYKEAVANVGSSTTEYDPDTRFVRNGDTISETDAVTTDTDDSTSYGWDEVPWDDSRWDDWVDQGSLSDYVTLEGTSYLSAFSSMGLSAGTASDGPGESGTGGYENQTWWCSEVVMASTWNPELIERVGEAYGRQCVRVGITSCFGPAMNTHRSPFGGRNFEYYSEDGYLAGMMCVAETAGIQSEGVGTFNKHFMLNDLDGGRSGQMAFCNEQALREIYIRAWEYSMKNDKAPMSGMMASLNRIGATWANRGVYTGIVREEFGWHGLAISDGMDGVNYSGAVKATFSGIACLLWTSTVNGSEADNDGYIFTGGNTSASNIADYYGVYQLREITRNRLWYDTHMYRTETVFTMDYYEALESYNYETMDVADLTTDNSPSTDSSSEGSSGCGSSITTMAWQMTVVTSVAVLVALFFVLKKREER